MLFSQGTVIYKNTFDGAAGLSPRATTPEINDIAVFTDAATENIATDGSGKLQSLSTAGFASYQFRLFPTPLNDEPGLTDVKATIVMRAPSNDWISFSFGEYHSNNRPLGNPPSSNTWFLVKSNSFEVFGGEGTANGGGFAGMHTVGDTLTLEYTYHFNKTVTLVSNGDTIASGLPLTHTQGGVEADPVIHWFMLSLRYQPTIAEGGGYIDELTIEVNQYPEYEAPEAPVRNLEGKEVFQNHFPLTLSFRNDRYGLSQGYEFWKNAHLPFHGITKKYLREEIDIEPVSAQLASQFSRNHPEKLMLLHLNGECTSAEDENTHKSFFPGHWVYLPGTALMEDVDPSQKEIRVASAAPFSMKAYTIHGGSASGQKLPGNVLLVRLGDSGNKLWYESEYAVLEAVNYETNTITLKRGQFFSTPISFESGKTYIAPIASDHWGGFIMWYYNLATSCPLDQYGRSAADVWLAEIKKWFAPSGILHAIDGIGFDVLYFDKSNQREWDIDNDGVADGGVIDGMNLYRLGSWAFLKNLRKAFGDEFLITADGWADRMQRAVGVLNGMETEGHCRPNDGYRQVSRTINQHTYWNMYNDAKYSFSYITNKLRHVHDDTDELRWPLRRMGLGLASCLGVAYAMPPPLSITSPVLEPEIFGGSLNTPGWLGKPLADMVYVMENSNDLLGGLGIEMNSHVIGQLFDFSGSTYHVEDGELLVSGNNPNPYANQEIKGPNISLPQGDLLVFVEARALDGFYDLEENTRVPRMINVKLEGYLPDPDEPVFSRNFANQLAGFMGTAGYTPMSFYFRDQGRSSGTLRLIFEAEEQGGFAIRNLRVYNAPCLLAREFENGVVLVNTSQQPQSFDLKQLFPGTKQFKQLKSSAYEEGTAVVPGLDALFLIKDSPQNIQEQKRADNFILYPNPGGSVINCIISEKLQGDISWYIHDALGRMVLSGRQNAMDQPLKFDISELHPGFYSFRLISEEIYQDGKFIKR